MQITNNGVNQALQQCEQIVHQLINQTQQASQNYQMLLQQEQQNAQRLEELAQREQRAAQTIQTALQGHNTVIQQLQHVTQLCKQIEQMVQTQSIHAAYSPNAYIQNQPAGFSQHQGTLPMANAGMNVNSNYRSMQ